MTFWTEVRVFNKEEVLDHMTTSRVNIKKKNKVRNLRSPGSKDKLRKNIDKETMQRVSLVLNKRNKT